MTTETVAKFPDVELVYEDDQPMDSPWHRSQMELLIQLTRTLWQGRTDTYVGGNMFVYFSVEQARKRDYRGPDYFAVTGVDGLRERQAWVVWEEDGRYPDVIIELLSPSTRSEDLGPKKDLYEGTFRTPEYFCFDPESGHLRGWRLLAGRYEPLLPGSGGRLESRVLGATLGLWEGTIDQMTRCWVRVWNDEQELVPTQGERAEAERTCAEAERARAEAERARAEAERARAEAERARADVAERAARLVGLHYKQGPAAAAQELRRCSKDERGTLMTALEAIDPDIADALRSAWVE